MRGAREGTLRSRKEKAQRQGSKSTEGTNRAKQKDREKAGCLLEETEEAEAAKGGSHRELVKSKSSEVQGAQQASEVKWTGPGISFPQEAGHLPLSLDLAVGSEQQRLPVTKSSAGSSGPQGPQSKFKAKRTTSELG